MHWQPERHAKIHLLAFTENIFMDAEQINLIGTQLASLKERTLDLRGYL